MATPVRIAFARWCRQTRLDLDVTQLQLGTAVGVSRAHIAAIETGRANPSIALVDRIGEALGIEFELTARRPVIHGGSSPRDAVHARCSGYVQRRLDGVGWLTAREVEIVQGRFHGWIDLLAFDPRTRSLLIIEIKTAIDDLGAIERQLSWYERLAGRAASDRGWHPVRIQSWLLALATGEVDAAVREQRDVLLRAFPVRAQDMRASLHGPALSGLGRGLALIDPRSRRQAWLIPTRSDGRRSVAPYRDRADAARAWSRG
jgi:transcriptional regulator with XRE-family HTH domain